MTRKSLESAGTSATRISFRGLPACALSWKRGAAKALAAALMFLAAGNAPAAEPARNRPAKPDAGEIAAFPKKSTDTRKAGGDVSRGDVSRDDVSRSMPSAGDGRGIRAGARLFALLGRDNNVFLSEAGRQVDHYARGGAELWSSFPVLAGGVLRAEAAGEQKRFFDLQDANELFGSATAEYEQRATDTLTAGVSDEVSFTDVNLLDPQGDFFPRRTFRSVRHTPRARASWDISEMFLADGEFGASYENAEETTGRESLDYDALVARAGISALPARTVLLGLSAEVSRRNYRTRRNLDRTGLEGAPGEFPRLDLMEHVLRARARYLFPTGETMRFGYTLRGLSDDFAGYYDFREQRVDLGLEVDVARLATSARAGDLKGRVDMWYADRRYRHRPVLSGVGRLREVFFGAQGELSLSLSTGWRLLMRASVLRLRSTEPDFSYRKTEISVGMSYEFGGVDPETPP